MLTILNHKGLGLHLDLGQMTEAEEDITALFEKTNGQLCHLHLSAPNFDLSPERMPIYLDVIAELKRLDQVVDVVLEVQSLNENDASVLLSMSEELAQACK